MARIIGRLTARKVATAQPPRGKQWVLFPDGGNLTLQVTTGAKGCLNKSWLFKYQLLGRRREMGLGPYPDVSLAQARARAQELRAQLREDVDPLEQKQARRRALLAERARTVTFRECAEMYLKLHAPGWKDAKHNRQWLQSLRDYVYPKIGALSVAEVDQPAVLKCVEVIWSVKTVTAGRCLNRIQRILDYATASGFRSGDNPARHIAESLPKKSTIAKVEHFPAMPFEDVPAFMAELRAQGSLAARQLEFTILTGARAGMANATWDEFDFRAKVWTVPGGKMKKGKEHRTPLSDRVLDLLRELPREPGEPRLFPLAIHAMDRVLKRLRPGAAVSIHGFRSSLTTWAQERTAYPHAVIEQALAHGIPSATERAYKRGDLFEKRRRMMAQWATFCETKPAAETTGATVLPMHARVSANA